MHPLADDKVPPTIPPTPDANGNGDGPRYEPLDISYELRDSYLKYAMSVIVSRALPDVRDGLKPSQRRILVAMHDLNLGPASSTSKCAGIIGETMKRYHPHGDQSIYSTLVHMAQDWAIRYRLIHPQGNFGSIAGLPPAAHRYTEARLSHIAAEMLADLDSDTVDFIDNYDGKYREPLVLPCKFPNLLVNGSDGIAVGMATEIPPHNLGEVCTALTRLIENPDLTLPEIMEIIPGPDFPTGNIICGRQGIIDGYTTGRGKITIRGRAHIVEDENPKKIIITEVPYQVNRGTLCADIKDAVESEKIKDIRDFRDESSAKNGEPVRLVIELKKGADPEKVLNQLYEYTTLQKTQSMILLALVDGRPQWLSLKQMLEEFLRHRIQVLRRRTEYLLREAKKRTHLLEGQLIAISSLDEIIALIRSSSSRSAAKQALQELAVAASVLSRALGSEHFASLQEEIGVHDSYNLTEAQAEAIVRMQLGQLAALERDEIVKEYNDLREKIRGYETLLSDDANIKALIRDDLETLRGKYGDARRTEFTGQVGRFDMEALIEPETQAVTFSHEGYIKRLPLNSFRSQHRGGKGVKGGETRENDFLEHFFVASTHDYLLCFTNRGHMYWLRVFDIPQAGRTSVGRHIAQVLSLKQDERITSIIAVQKFDHERDQEKHLVMGTRRGLVKKTALLDYSNVRAGGIIGINLDEGDTLINVVLTQPGDEVVLVTRNGMAIRFAESDARSMGRNTRGVKGINLQGDDEVVGMVVAAPESYLLTVCEAGYGKRTPFGANHQTEDLPEPDADAESEMESAEEPAGDEEAGERSSMSYRLQRRGGKGIRDIKTGSRNGKVVGVSAVREDDDIMLITVNGLVTRTHVSEVRITGRNTMGVRIVSLNEGDRLAALARIAPEVTEIPEEVEDEVTG
jgi:DNA gyrase subunit A